MNDLIEGTRNALRQYFSISAVNSCERYFPLIHKIVEDYHHATLLTYLSSLMEYLQTPELKDYNPNMPLMDWILAVELRRDERNAVHPDAHVEKCKVLLSMYVYLLFKPYLLEPTKEGEKPKPKTFGIGQFRIEVSKAGIFVFFDTRSVLYEMYTHKDSSKQRFFVDMVVSLLNRMRMLYSKFESLEKSVEYNRWGKEYHAHVLSAPKCMARMHYRFEKFDNQKPSVRLHVCIIAVFVEKAYFVAVGIDTRYYLCAEAKAMRKATEIMMSNDGTFEATIAQQTAVPPMSKLIKDDLSFYKVQYHMHHIHMSKKVAFDVVIAVFMYHGMKECYTAAVHFGGATTVMLIAKDKVARNIKRMKQDSEDDFFWSTKGV